VIVVKDDAIARVPSPEQSIRSGMTKSTPSPGTSPRRSEPLVLASPRGTIEEIPTTTETDSSVEQLSQSVSLRSQF
jgi:hypothetical protein